VKKLPDRSRRVLQLGGLGLALTLFALATAVWALVEAEGDRVRRRTEDRAARHASELLTSVARDVADEIDASWVVLDAAFRPLLPEPPRSFNASPPIVDEEAAFYLGVAEESSGPEAVAALELALASEDSAVRLRAALAAARQSGDAAQNLVAARLPAALRRTRDGVHLGLLAGSAEAFGDARVALGGPDEDVARALLLGAVGMSREELDSAVLGRRRALADARELAALIRVAPPVSGDDSPRVLIMSGGKVVVAVAEAPSSAAGPTPVGARWWVRRAVEPAALRWGGGVPWDGFRLVPPGARIQADEGAVRLPGSGGYRVASPPDSRGAAGVLLIAGFSVASLVAIAAFAAFARSVRREARLTRLRGEFVATVGHELRTPVAVIRSAAEALALGRATRDEDRERLIQGIVRESERLSGLLGNVLDFARMEAGRRDLARTDCDVGQVVRETVDAHRAALDRVDVEVEVHVETGLPSLQCDRDALGAALANLLDNAAKFGRDRHDIAVRVRRDGVHVVLEVVDHGPGVPDAEKRRVFERFFRGAAPDVQETRGTGIGLALVRHAAEAHDGRVEVVDTEGGGATFRLLLPIGQG